MKERLANGQCIHCGIQTHEVEKKRFGKGKKTPLNIPNKVEHGCCLRESCLKTGSQVLTEERPSSFGSMSSQTAGKVGTAVGTVVGAVVGVPELGDVVGSITEAGASVMGCSDGIDTSQTTSATESCFGSIGSNPMAAYMESLQQPSQTDPMAAYMELLQQQSQTSDAYTQQYLNQAQQQSIANCQQIMYQAQQQAQQESDAANSQLQDYMAQLQQCSQTANADLAAQMANLQMGMQQQVPQTSGRRPTADENRKLASLHDQAEKGLFSADICCPNQHAMVERRPGSRQCDLCDVQTEAAPMMGCVECDFDLCLQCVKDANTTTTQSAHQKCCSGHKAYRFVTRCGFICNYCGKAKPEGAILYYCKLCDWGTCSRGVCADRARLSFLWCPNDRGCATVSKVSLPHTCDICFVGQPVGTELYKCHLCNWSVCLHHRV